jgi:hypothetical protein
MLLGYSFIVQLFLGDTAMAGSTILLVIGQFFQVLAVFGFFSIQPRPFNKLAVTGFILMIAGLTINLFSPADRVFFLTGLLLFAISVQRNKSLPSWGFWIWLVGSSLALAFSLIGFNLFLGLSILVISAALIGLGMPLRKATPFPGIQ